MAIKSLNEKKEHESKMLSSSDKVFLLVYFNEWTHKKENNIYNYDMNQQKRTMMAIKSSDDKREHEKAQFILTNVPLVSLYLIFVCKGGKPTSFDRNQQRRALMTVKKFINQNRR